MHTNYPLMLNVNIVHIKKIHATSNCTVHTHQILRKENMKMPNSLTTTVIVPPITWPIQVLFV